MRPEPVDLLLIEDDPNEAELTIRTLKKHNITNHILHFQNGEDALDYLLKPGQILFPRLILLDLKMPLMDGFDFLKKLKSHPEKNIIPVVVFSTSNESQDINRAYRLGANAYVVKPVDYSRLNEVIVLIGSFWLSLNQT